MKQDFFNLRRFARYFWQDIISSVSKYWPILAVLSVASIACYFGAKYGPTMVGKDAIVLSYHFREQLFLGLACVFVFSMPIVCYGYFTDKKNGQIRLAVPVSTFEKTLSMILNCIVVMPALFFFGVIGADELVVAMGRCGFDKEVIHQEGVIYDLINCAVKEDTVFFSTDKVKLCFNETDSLWVNNVVSEEYDYCYSETLSWSKGISLSEMERIITSRSGKKTAQHSIASFHCQLMEIQDPFNHNLKYTDAVINNSDFDLLKLRKPFWEGCSFKTWGGEYNYERKGPDSILTKSNWGDWVFQILFFLFGALFFKKNKGAKSILSLIVVVILESIPFILIMMHYQKIYPEGPSMKEEFIRFIDSIQQFFGYICIASSVLLCYLIYRRVKKLTF